MQLVQERERVIDGLKQILIVFEHLAARVDAHCEASHHYDPGARRREGLGSTAPGSGYEVRAVLAGAGMFLPLPT